MTADERVTYLEAALALERAKVHELSAALAVAVQRTAEADASRARMDEAAAHVKALRRDRNRRYRDARKASPETPVRRAEDVSETSYPPPPLLDGSPPPSAPSSPSPLSSPPPVSSSKEPQAGPEGDGFCLTPPTSKRSRKPRTASAAESLFAALQGMREERCADAEEPVVPERWDFAKQNTLLGPLARGDENQALFEAAWGLYLADDGERVREPAWSLSWFMSSGVRARYETRAARGERT